MATTENGVRAFSTRLPCELVDQIDARRKITKRTRNAEIEVLLVQAIDLNVQRDRQIMEAMKDTTAQVQL